MVRQWKINCIKLPAYVPQTAPVGKFAPKSFKYSTSDYGYTSFPQGIIFGYFVPFDL